MSLQRDILLLIPTRITFLVRNEKDWAYGEAESYMNIPSDRRAVLGRCWGSATWCYVRDARLREVDLGCSAEKPREQARAG
jgi:hypothetical protein